MTNKQLEIVITSNAEQAIAEFTHLNLKFNEIYKKVLEVKSAMAGTSTTFINSFNTINNGSEKATTGINKLSNGFGNLARRLVSIYALRQIAGVLTEGYKQAINYTETLNLFNTALKGSASQGRDFQEQMGETFGTNREEMMKYQGLFTAISNSLGLTEDASYKVGKSLTSLSVDLSSLYNKNIKDVNEALKSGLVGQTKPVRSLGMDITERTLNNELKLMGINDRTVAQMSQTEKVILRYNTMLKQSAIAHGDWAKTIESPANQLRIFKNQLVEVQKWLGNIFYGTLGSILPYINGFTMALKEVIKTIAVMFGYTEQTFGGALYDTEATDDGLDSANAKAQKVKDTLMGFDEINNISKDTGNDSGVGTGVDPRLLASMKEYENTMLNVQMKATKIRDKIMDWLGFTKKVNDLTGETYFKLDEGYTNIKKIKDAFLTFISALVLFGTLKSLVEFKSDLSAIYLMLKSAILPVLTAIATALGISIGWLVAIIAVIVLAIVTFKHFYDTSEAFRSTIDNGIKSLINFLKQGIEPLKNVLDILIITFKNLYEGVVKPFIDWLVIVGTPVIEILKETLDMLWKNVLAPLADCIGSVLYKAFLSITTILNTTVIPIFKIWNDILNYLWKNILMPIVEWLLKVFKPIFESIFSYFGDTFKNLKTFFNGFLDFITGVFTGNWKLAFGGLKEIFRGMINGLIAGINFFVKMSMTPINMMIDAINKVLPKNQEIKNIIFKIAPIPEFATGGFPTIGSMFLANESGPEMVGKIGNKTAVMNNDQIVSSVSQGVARAVASVMGGNGNQTINLVVDGKVLTDVVVNGINSQMQQYGTSPLRG